MAQIRKVRRLLRRMGIALNRGEDRLVKQAIAVESAGVKVDFKAKRELQLPEELTRILKKDPRLAKAFDSLTPGRQRAYVLHFTGAKQSQTRTARIEKCIPKILAGLGFNDR